MKRDSNNVQSGFIALAKGCSVLGANAEREPQYIEQPYPNLYGPISTDLTFASCINGVVSTQPILHGVISNHLIPFYEQRICEVCKRGECIWLSDFWMKVWIAVQIAVYGIIALYLLAKS